MNEIIIDSEFKSLIPPLSAEEYAGLEENILTEGCRDALVLWGNVLIDGHNRYEICTKHGFHFNTVQADFDSREDAIAWIIKNQFGRRNLPAYERARLALRLKPIIAAKAKEQQIRKPESVCQKSDKQKIDTKREIASVAGVSHDTIAKVEKIESLATPELKKQLSSGEVSINQAYNEVTKPHVVNNSGNNEWYTPREYIEAARNAMGSIDLDPASSEFANRTVKAGTYFDQDANGLDKTWFGNVWMNPPYSADLVRKFTAKMVDSYKCGDIRQAIVLVNNATETEWFGALTSVASAVVFPKGRISYNQPNGEKLGAPLQGQAFIYIGGTPERFFEEFGKFGWRATL